ncbi:recombinase family protein [Salmonella enterica]|nr:recombinase family protein [Salmonella enterica]
MSTEETTTKGRTFAYCRVSTTEQDVKNQMHAIRERGYKVMANRVVSDKGVSGSVPAMQRDNFAKMVNHKLEAGDELVVLKLDRLGRDNIDVQQTIQMLTDMGVTVHCLDLPVSNLSSSEGKLMLQMFSAFAEFERNRIRERTVESIERRKAEGLSVGRPEATDTTKAVQKCKADGLSQSKTARALGISIPTVKRHWNK